MVQISKHKPDNARLGLPGSVKTKMGTDKQTKKIMLIDSIDRVDVS